MRLSKALARLLEGFYDKASKGFYKGSGLCIDGPTARD